MLPRAGAASVELGNVLAGNPGNSLELGMGIAKLSWEDFPEPREAEGSVQGIWGMCLTHEAQRRNSPVVPKILMAVLSLHFPNFTGHLF